MLQNVGTMEILVFSAIALSVFLLLAFLYMWLKLRAFMKGKNAKSLEDKIRSLIDNAERISQENRELKELVIKILEEDKRNLKAFSVVKFNPFSESGHGKQSFASAVLNRKGKGFILSTLSVRGETHVFIKEVDSAQDTEHLSDEEKQALEKAAKKL